MARARMEAPDRVNDAATADNSATSSTEACGQEPTDRPMFLIDMQKWRCARCCLFSTGTNLMQHRVGRRSLTALSVAVTLFAGALATTAVPKARD